MPRSEKDNRINVISIESPLQNIERPADVRDVNRFDEFLGQFKEGIPDTPEGRKLIEDARAIPTDMLPCLDPLLKKGLFGGPDAFPKVEEVIKHGKRIIIVEPDGTKTNYSDKYLNNPTVDLLLKMEKDPEYRTNYGRMLLGHLGLFLGGKGKYQLENYEKEFGKGTPSDPANKPRVFIGMPDGPAAAFLDKESTAALEQISGMEKAAEDEQKKLGNQLAEKNKIAEEAHRKTEEKRQDLANTANPELPEKPREKNAFRRFLTSLHLWSHSQKYKEELQNYNRIKEERSVYDDKKKQLETLESEEQKLKNDAEAVQNEIAKSKEQFELQLKQFKESAQYQDCREALEEGIGFAQQYQDEKDEFLRKTFEYQTSAKVLQETLRNPGAVEKIQKSRAGQFSEGSVETLIDIIKNREENDRALREGEAKLTEEQKNTIRKAKKSGYKLDDQVRIDNAPYQNINKFVTLVDYQAASKNAYHAERNYKNDPENKQRSFDKHTNSDYQAMVKSSKECFEEVFGMKPDVATVQAVIDSVNLNSYVKQGITQIDKKVYDPEIHTLPKVNDVNVGDMTLLLMSGIKTATMGPQKAPQPVHNEQPSEAAPEHENQQLVKLF